MSDDEHRADDEDQVVESASVVSSDYAAKEEQWTDSQNGQPLRPFSFSLRKLLWGLTLCVVIVGLLSWITRVARVNQRQVAINRALEDTYLGLVNFDSARGRLPADCVILQERVLNSWRFHIAPYWGLNHLPSKHYRSAWDAPINKEARARSCVAYCVEGVGAPPDTNLFGVVGPGTAFERSKYAGRSIRRLEEVPSDCILVVEVADSNTNWMQPGDYEVEQLLAATGKLGDTVKGILPDRIHVLFADGEAWALSPDTPMEAFKPFLTIAAAKTASRENLLGPYRVD